MGTVDLGKHILFHLKKYTVADPEGEGWGGGSLHIITKNEDLSVNIFMQLKMCFVNIFII